MYKSNFYQRMKGLNYKVVLPLALAFGAGYSLNKYLSEKSMDEMVTESKTEQSSEEIAPTLETKEPDKVILRIEKNDGTIEEIVGNRSDLIICTEEDIFGKRKTPKKK